MIDEESGGKPPKSYVALITLLVVFGLAFAAVSPASVYGSTTVESGEAVETTQLNEVTVAERSIDQTELAPGESTTVTVEIETSEVGDPSVIEEFDPAFADVGIENVNPPPVVSAVRDDNSALTVVWQDTNSVSVKYQVTVPEDAEDGDTISISGEAQTTDGPVTISGDNQISVIEPDTIGPIGDFENVPTDPDGDGLYEDINGDDEFNIVDIQALFVNLEDETIQNNPENFDFNQDGNVDVVDVQKLFSEL